MSLLWLSACFSLGSQADPVGGAPGASPDEEVPISDSAVPPPPSETPPGTTGSTIAPSSCTPGPRRGPGTSLWCTLQLDAAAGGDRRYLLYLPRAYDGAELLPVVLDLHGGGGMDPPALHSLVSGFAEASEDSDEPFVVAWPEGSLGGAEWTTCDYTGPNCPRIAGSVPGLDADQVDDRAFLLAVIDDLVATLSVDPARIYATGLSSGGAMAEILACGASERLAGIAPMAIGIDAAGQPRPVDNYVLSDGCAPTRALPVFLAHAPTDQIVPYAEGLGAVAFWRDTFGCGASVIRATLEHDGFGNDPTVCTEAECGGVSVVACEVDASLMGLLTFGGHVIYVGDDLYHDWIPTPGLSGPRLADEVWRVLRGR